MFNSSVVKIGDISVGGESPLVFILGPCQIENRDHALFMAEKIVKFVNLLHQNLFSNQALIRQIDLQ